MSEARRFAPSVGELDACFVVTDSTRQKLAYDEARTIAVNIAKLPELLCTRD
jgi:hypothetical protein